MNERQFVLRIDASPPLPTHGAGWPYLALDQAGDESFVYAGIVTVVPSVRNLAYYKVVLFEWQAWVAVIGCATYFRETRFVKSRYFSR